MARQSGQRNDQRGKAVALPAPSITLDIVMPKADGGVDQQRPGFNDFDKAMKALASFKTSWEKYLTLHKKAAKGKP